MIVFNWCDHFIMLSVMFKYRCMLKLVWISFIRFNWFWYVLLFSFENICDIQLKKWQLHKIYFLHEKKMSQYNYEIISDIQFVFLLPLECFQLVFDLLYENNMRNLSSLLYRFVNIFYSILYSLWDLYHFDSLDVNKSTQIF